jgi:hypothetical protein
VEHWEVSAKIAFLSLGNIQLSVTTEWWTSEGSCCSPR